MIADFKQTGGKNAGIALATYMLDPAGKQDIDAGHPAPKEGNPERILLVATDHAMPILAGVAPEQGAMQFLNSVESWNKRHRIGQKQPKNMWEQMVVAFSPEDDNKLTPQKAIAITRQALQKVASGNRPTLYTVHGDTDHLHVHVMYATVNDEGLIHNRHRDYRLWELAMEQLETEHGLLRVTKRTACAKDNPDRMPDGTNPASAEYQAIERTGAPSCKMRIREIIDRCVESIGALPPHRQFATFIERMGKEKVGISANIQSTGNVAGLRFHYGIFQKKGIKGSRLGNNYAWSKLSVNIGFDDNNKRHLNLLKAADCRIGQFLSSRADNQKQPVAEQQPLKKSTGAMGSARILSNRTSSGGGNTEIPDFYPDWLKQYIRAILAEANQQLARAISEKEKNMDDLLELAAELLATLYNVKLRQSKRDISNNQKLIDTATETDLKPTNFTP